MGDWGAILAPLERYPQANPGERRMAERERQEDTLRAPLPPMRWTIAESSLRAAPGAFAPMEEQQLAALGEGYRATVPARCVAAEYARLGLQEQQQATRPLIEFIVARCGASFVEARTLHSTVIPMRRPNEAEALELNREEIAGRWRSGEMPTHGSLGVASLHDRRHVSAAMGVIGEELVRVDASGPALAMDGFVSVEATLLKSVEAIRVRITHGLSAVATCEVERDAEQLHVRCPYEASDESEVIEFVAIDAEGHPVGGEEDYLALRDATVLRSYETRAQSGTPSELGRAVAERINALRVAMGLDALTFVPEQSEANGLMTSFFFRERLNAETLTVASAGWEMPVMLSWGDALAAEAPLGSSVDSLTARLLRTASERDMLLAPAATHIAVGMRLGLSTIQTIATVYRAFPEPDPEGDRARLVAIAQAERARAGLPAFNVVPMPAPFEQALAQIASGASPTSAFQAASRAYGPVPESTRFGVLALEDLNPSTVAGDSAGTTTIALSVVPFRPERSARGEYLVFVLLSAP